MGRITISSIALPRTYGHAKLSGLVQTAGAFEMKRADRGTLDIRVKAGPAKPQAKAAR